MRILGMISGTSHDGIDVAIVDFQREGRTLTARLEYADSVPYDAGLRRRLIDALPPAPVGFDVVCELDTRIGQAFGAAAAGALARHAERHADAPVAAVCSHGQTVFHWVTDGRAEGTLQLGQPAWIASATGLPVIADVRAADVAAGGQGAPLVPVLDELLLRRFVADGDRAGALNLGGIANVTVCAPDAATVAWDIGPANALIDAVVTASAAIPDTFDRDGRLARAGAVVPELLELLLAEPYYALPAPKSSGKELFHLGYVEDALAGLDARPDLPDLVATLTELTAVTVAEAVTASGLEVLVASGGGVRNPALMERLAAHLPDVRLLTADDLGIPSDTKEAIAFALIGWATLSGLPANVPSCTGATGPRVLGSITPAPGRPLPPTAMASTTAATWPEALRFQEPDR